ncbi:MAG: TrkH family potassium uptake protein [Acidimicrobiia bacterium]|nr:TrkH family potassium uptake protein [Acidimicrobiia bacterium]
MIESATQRRLLVIVSAVVGGGAVAMLPAIITGLIYREWTDTLALVAAAAIGITIGLIGRHYGTGRGSFTSSEGFAAVALSWIVLILFGTLPYLFSGALPGLIDPLFETAAGFTTTGATTLADPGELSHSMLLWRATSQWVGGMGIIVLSIAVLPMLGAGGVELARAEAPGPEPERMTPRFRNTAERLWWLYVGLTVLLAIVLAFGDMKLFEAIAHGMTTVSTGGFSTEPGSIGAFSAYTQWVVIAFMLISATSFALHFRAWRRPRAYLESKEFLAYISIVGIAVLLFALGTWSLGAGIESRVRDAVFTGVTMVTGTGYATLDWAAFAPGLLLVTLVCMFLGGMAGSTAGAVKTYRLGILFKTIGSSLRRIVYPRMVAVQRFEGRPIEPRLVHGVVAFFVLYVGFFVVGAILLGFFEPQLDLVSIGSASASAMGNIGPALGELGPTSTYAGLGADSKIILALLMVVGRLEIYPVVILLTHRWWRR